MSFKGGLICSSSENLEHLQHDLSDMRYLYLDGICILYVNPVLSFKNIICGFTESSEQNICQNFILLLFKKFLYQQRSRQSGANIKSFSNSIHTIYRIEYKIAAANYKLDSHFKKWEHIKPLLPSGGAAVALN